MVQMTKKNKFGYLDKSIIIKYFFGDKKKVLENKHKNGLGKSRKKTHNKN
ncbi:hypothetical protein BpHYR1_011573 [Brachionus plicatilis]|uniref:Uncharacterized protein n=1 Tax=Brachionus plicatilis TaxID=10195 RepID=A0A3M7RPM1_BRAPC|nr:hypothetical protein BpHYR1_011573 [Brachionus plicatilis]